jgi:SAM-dependent methyltransferase
MTGPTGRFSGRVSEYALYRPGYPPEVFRTLSRTVCTPSAVVADIGSGTGIFTAPLAGMVKKVHAVEPNPEMREYARRALSTLANVECTGGRAEETGLGDSSVDVITAAQAFHWFHREHARREFQRILKPGGAVALVWYERRTTGDPFLEGYEHLMLGHSIDYRQVDHRNVTPAVIEEFFWPNRVAVSSVYGEQQMDFTGVRGRVLSSSYAPPAGHPSFEPLMKGLKDLFDRCQRAGRVTFCYDFNIYISRIESREGTGSPRGGIASPE